jgi:hypothetical protein
MSIRSNSEIITELHLLTNQLISLENENLKFINNNRSQTIKNIIIYAKNVIALLKNYKKIFEELMFKLPDMLGNIDIGVVKQHISNIIITIENIITINDQGNRGVNESNILEISREIIYLTNINVYNAKRSVARVINAIQSSISPHSPPSLSPLPLSPQEPGLRRQRAIGRPSLNILSLPPPPPPTSLASSSDEEGFGLKYRKKRSKKRANYTKRRETRSSKMKKKARSSRKTRSSRLF